MHSSLHSEERVLDRQTNRWKDSYPIGHARNGRSRSRLSSPLAEIIVESNYVGGCCPGKCCRVAYRWTLFDELEIFEASRKNFFGETLSSGWLRGNVLIVWIRDYRLGDPVKTKLRTPTRRCAAAFRSSARDFELVYGRSPRPHTAAAYSVFETNRFPGCSRVCFRNQDTPRKLSRLTIPVFIGTL